MNILIMEKATALDLQHFEDDRSYDQLQRARQESLYRPYQVITQITGNHHANHLDLLGHRGLDLLEPLAWSAHPALAIALALDTSLLCQAAVSHRPHAKHQTCAVSCISRTSLPQPTRVKKCAFSAWVISFSAAIVRASRRSFAVDRALAKQKALITTPLDILTQAIASVSQIYALFFAIAARNMGMLAGYIQAIILVQNSSMGLLTSLGQLYENNLFMRNSVEFLDIASTQLNSGTRPFPTCLQKALSFAGSVSAILARPR